MAKRRRASSDRHGEQNTPIHNNNGGGGVARSRPRILARRREWLVSGLVLVICVVFVVNAGVLGTSVDLTPERRFSLSNASTELLRSLDEPVEIRFFVSEDLRELSDEPARMEQLLRRYDEIGGSMVDLEVIDASDDGAERAESAGLRAEEIQDVDEEAVAPQSVYSGISVHHLDRERVVPFVFGHEQIEYQVSGAIWDVVRTAPPRVAVMLGTQGEEFREDYNQLATELDDRFDITVLEHGRTDIPADIDALLLLGSRDLTGEQSQAVTAFLEGGGSAMLAVDGIRMDLQTLEAEPVSGESADAASDMLSQVGMVVEPYALLDTRSNPLQVSGGVSSAGGYPPWVSTDSRNADPDHVVTRFTSGVDFFWPSPLRMVDPDGGSNGPLVVSSPEAWIIGEPSDLRPDNRRGLTRNREETLGTYPIAAWSENAPAEGTRTVVVGDSDFASNLVFYSESFQNFMFIERSLLWLMKHDDIAGLHARSRAPDSLDRIEAEFPRLITGRIVEVVNTVAIPFGVLLVGFFHLRRRRKRDAKAAAA